MYSKLLAGYVNPDTITNPVLGPKLQGFIGHFGDSPAAFFQLFLPKLLTLGLIIGVLFFFFIIIIGAIQWISSGGDKNALEEAKHKITNAIIGVVILFSIFAILKLIENFFGISILTLDIGSLAI